ESVEAFERDKQRAIDEPEKLLPELDYYRTETIEALARQLDEAPVAYYVRQECMYKSPYEGEFDNGWEFTVVRDKCESGFFDNPVSGIAEQCRDETGRAVYFLHTTGSYIDHTAIFVIGDYLPVLYYAGEPGSRVDCTIAKP